MPDFALELEKALRSDNLNELADSIRSLEIKGRCSCGDLWCSTFYVGGPQDSLIEKSDGTVCLDANAGMVNVDIVNGKITTIEVLDRIDVWEILNREFEKLRKGK